MARKSKEGMLISKKMEKALNEQLILEAEARFKYLAMGSWWDKEGYPGTASFFMKHAQEEDQHMMKIFQFIMDTGGHAVVPAVSQPDLKFKDVPSTCAIALQQEQKVTKAIHKLVDISVSEKDHVTYDFLRFFVEEQREEEVLFMTIMDKIELIGKGPQAMYYIDKELATAAAEHE